MTTYLQQYYTPRGSIPATVVEEQVLQVPIDPNDDSTNGPYPHMYTNQESTSTAPNGTIFQRFEQRNRPSETPLYEVPVNCRMDLNKKAAPFMKVKRREERPTDPRDRGRVVQNELNTPGPFRGVVAVDKNTGQSRGVAGVMYHPQGNISAFQRAQMEPLDREGRQYIRRFVDDAADPHRVTTWPPRDEDSEDLTTYENRYKQVRRTRPPQQTKTGKQKVQG
ncbi:hypothetical protein BFJ66_g3468 [Fusarium oxysporum f. sp. cepae]|uniref:Uncharacterized protein n=1 Tax=Fusarium oxysporum f. sp. cepae TaxID=396571 RepID=A0A3L6P7U9_FUSOX|nr:hypothetical protein BFJ65_g1509 [Fusarium oxysporum f. sp. cepae]RKK37497.1 hypothetical protein BFJ67_g12293 [Fusarium oxysporum f. sp. cepae]RKK56917.1 hypothetical protein BFJ66_g3468 [Fusarium oxysporum f. sp. cepae]